MQRERRLCASSFGDRRHLIQYCYGTHPPQSKVNSIRDRRVGLLAIGQCLKDQYDAFAAPIAPHLASDRSLILQPEATVKLQIFTGSQPGVFSADGQMNCEIANGATVTIRKSKFVTQFLRRRPPTYFYQVINAKLLSSEGSPSTESHHVT